MRHRVKDHKFNRHANARKGLLKSLLCALIEHGEVTTTITKAKVLRQLADRVVHQAQTDTVATRRNLHRVFGRRDVVNTLVESVAPNMKDRQSGFVTFERVGTRRGDNVEQIKVAFVSQRTNPGSLKNPAPRAAEKKSAPMAKAASAAKEETVVKEDSTAVKKVASKSVVKKESSKKTK